MARWGVIYLLLLALIGCDRPRPLSAVAAPPRRVADFRPIVQLLPNRSVHAAVDSIGNIFYTVETEDGQDAVFVVAENGLPRATRLSSASILSTLGETGGNGAIQDLAAGAGGTIWFYFSGSRGRSVIVCLGQFSLRDGLIRIVYDANQLKRDSGMNDSIALARGTLIAGDPSMHLLLRHTDAYAVFRFPAERAAPPATNELVRVLSRITHEDRTINLIDPQLRLAPGSGDSLLLLDRTTGELFDVDPEGHATLRILLAQLPKEISPPLPLKDQRLILFAGDSELIESELANPMAVSRQRVTWPAVVLIDGKALTMIDRDDLRVPAGFPAYAMRINQIVPAPGGTWIVYDRSSGQLMRMRLMDE
jgi:hypothetical protein